MKKRIVCDLDDTLALGTGPVEGRAPNQDLIEQLNKAHSDGYEIYILTARGQLSCNGDSQAADKKYRKVVSKWLNKSSLKWDILDFHKPLASLYIDDKACEPDYFEYDRITTGLSGEEVVVLGDKVVKKGPMSKSAFEWYEKAHGIVKVPKLYGLIDDTIMMEYVEHEKGMDHYEDACNEIEKFSKHAGNDFNFDAYLLKINQHLELAEDIFDEKEAQLMHYHLQSIETIMNHNKSFMHGDASIDNIIRSYNHGELYFIDPINQIGAYSGWLLDISKLAFSMKRFNNEAGYKYIMKRYSEYYKLLKILDMSWAIRILKYDKDNRLRWEKYIREIMEELNV